MNAYKTAQRLRAIATRLEKVVIYVHKFVPIALDMEIIAPLRFEINSLRALADEIRPPKESR